MIRARQTGHDKTPMRRPVGHIALVILVIAAGCATLEPYPAPPNGLDTYLDILDTSLDWSAPGLEAAKAARDAGDTQAVCDALLAYYRARMKPRFFFDSQDIPAIADAIREDMPEAADELIEAADRIVARTFPNSTSRTVVYRVTLPEDFSWTGNPTEDPEFVHMLQRSRFWQDLAFGYALTEDEHYAETFAAQMASWLRDVPLHPSVRGKPISPWWRTINPAIRGDTWLWAYAIFLHSPAMTPELHAQILGALAEHGRVLRHHHKDPSGNWCVMEMQGLLNIALMFPEFREATSWRDYARAMLVECMRRQIRADGVQLEQSPNYHKGCIRWFLEPMLLAERNGVAFPAEYRETLDSMGAFAVWATDPLGRTIAVSDSDREIETRMVLTSLGWTLDRPEYAYYRDVSHWHYWLFGVDGARALRTMPRTAPGETMRVFPEAGYVFGRSDWSPDGRYFVFDCGPRGRGHGHLDLLNVEIHGFGDVLIADAGRWLYDGGPLRRWLISTPAHNTINLDGQSHGTFETPARGAYELLAVEQRDGWLYVHGRHRAYRNMAGPPVIERRIWFDGDALWVVVDTVRSPEIHTIQQVWQFAATGARLDGLTAIARSPKGAQIQVAVAETAQHRVYLEESVVSPFYGSKHAADRLLVERRAANARFATALAAHPETAEPGELSIELYEPEGPEDLAVTVHTPDAEYRMAVEGTAWTVRKR